MKRILLTIFVLMACVTYAQSPTAFRSLDLVGAKAYGAPAEYNAWAGSILSYPLVGRDFDLSFGVSGKIVIDFTKIDLGRTWNILTYGDLGLPNYNNVNAFTSVVSDQEGIDVGLQGYTTFGNLGKQALTAYLNLAAKLNTFGDTQVNSYRFGAGVELSLRGEGLPIIVNVSPAYVLVSDKTSFSRLQNETVSSGFWMSNTFVIIPIGDKIGLLTQSTFAENVKLQVRIGLILSAGL